MMAVPSENKVEIFETQFTKNSTLDRQGKQPPTIPHDHSSVY